MKRQQIHVVVTTPAARDKVFALLADGSTWPRWAPIERFELERPGHPPPEGVGAIRVYHRGRTAGRDETVEVRPGQRSRAGRSPTFPCATTTGAGSSRTTAKARVSSGSPPSSRGSPEAAPC